MKKLLFYCLFASRGIIHMLLRLLMGGCFFIAMALLFLQPGKWPVSLMGLSVAFIFYCLTWSYDRLLLRLQPRDMNITLFR